MRTAASRRHRVSAVLAAVTMLVPAVAACGSSGEGGDDQRTVTVWNLDGQPDRLAAVKTINERFTQRTGVRVDEVAVQENQLPSLVASAAVSGTLPDLVSGLPLAYLRQLEQQRLLDTRTAADVVSKLDPATFAPQALQLSRDGTTQLGVPSDAWTQALYYRKDLFAERGLEPPNTYAAIQKAAATLNTADRSGITLATDPADPFTQQTFEWVALGNDCQLVDQEGQVQIAAAPCQTTFALYGDLARRYAPQGTQTVDSTRATYFAGQAAMTIWSTFLLDELGGLRDDARPTCPQCQKDPEWLAHNTGIITAVQGPGGSKPVGYGEIASWAVLDGATPAAGTYVEYMMSDGYQASLAIAPEGKYPVRRGTPDQPERFVQAWPALPAGVDRKKPLADIYGRATIDQLAEATNTMQRWAIPQGQGALLGPTVAELVIPKSISALAAGEPPAETASGTQDAVEEIQRSMR
jgi:multiple sugar transport system substrate-binding protein